VNPIGLARKSRDIREPTK